MELSKERLTMIAISALASILFLVYGLFYGPLIKDLKSMELEYRTFEISLSNTKEAISGFPKMVADKKLISEQEISLALDELTKQGKFLGINFLSMKVEAIQESEGQQYRMLPVSMETESSYEVLGEFFGSLDLLKQSLVTVKNFHIALDKEVGDKLKTDMTVYLYLLE